MVMRVFVTGGSGFVGGHVIDALIAAGHEVSALARSARSADVVQRLGASAVHGELGSVVEHTLHDVDVVIHAAAFVEEWGTREQFEKTNVRGTLQLLEVAQRAGVRRFIHIGTEAAVFEGQDLNHIDEDKPYPTRHRYLYSESKARAEHAVLEANREDFVTLSLRPSLIWGPRDRTVLPTLLSMVDEGRFVWINKGAYERSTTHIFNLVQAIIQSLTQGKSGEAYFIADDGVLTLHDFITRLLATQGVEAPTRSLPAWLIRPAAALIEGTWRLFRISATPPLHKFVAEIMSSHVTVNTTKAKAELGYQPRVSHAEGLRRLQAANQQTKVAALELLPRHVNTRHHAKEAY